MSREINIEQMKASWLHAVSEAEGEGFARMYFPEVLDALASLRKELAQERDEAHRLRLAVIKLDKELAQVKVENTELRANTGYGYLLEQVEGFKARAEKAEKERDEWKAGSEVEAREADRLRSEVAALKAKRDEAEGRRNQAIREESVASSRALACDLHIQDLQSELSALREREGKMNPPDGAFVALSHYQQADADGISVTVSRQAVEEAVAWYASWVAALPPAQAKGEEAVFDSPQGLKDHLKSLRRQEKP